MAETMGKEEIWKDIPEYEGLYQVSNHGKVRSLDRYVSNGKSEVLKRGKVLKQRVDKGYLRIGLSNICGTQKLYTVSRLILMVFDRFPKDGTEECNHKDGDKDNNYKYNLEWCTPVENVWHKDNILDKHTRGERNARASLTNKEVLKIKKLLIRGISSFKRLAKKYKVHPRVISNINCGFSWRSVGDYVYPINGGRITGKNNGKK